jgi:uncharacterized protein YbaR (Trm112 family)
MMRPMEDLQRFLGHLACPACHGDLLDEGHRLTCLSCAHTYPIDDGVPIFVDPELVDHDELDHLAGHGGPGDVSPRQRHKAEQATYSDRRSMAEFEIERPAGTARLYRFLLLEKFRRAVRPLGRRLDGWTALAVCGGSGMDAEFLARAGASVISSDISIGAARRTQERARRHGIAIVSIVADVEHLPFHDRSIDLVYVQDGPRRASRDVDHGASQRGRDPVGGQVRSCPDERGVR